MFEKSSGTIRHRRKWLLVAMKSWMLGGLVPLVGAIQLSAPMWLATLLAGLYLTGVIGAPRAWLAFRTERRGPLRADEEGLWLDGRLVVARSAIQHAYPLADGGGLVLRLLERGTPATAIDVAVTDDAEAAELLGALRLDAGRSLTEWELRGGTKLSDRKQLVLEGMAVSFAVAMGMLFTATGLKAQSVAFTMMGGTFVVAAMIGFLLARHWRAAYVTVGADGVRVRELRGTRFVPFSEIERVRSEGNDLILDLRDGTNVELHHPIGSNASLEADRSHEAKKLGERIAEQLAAHRRAPRVNLDVLTRAGRRAEEWLRATQALTEQNATFRTQAVPHEALWRVVEDASAAPTARAGAALALRRELDDAARTRLRVAADACAAPQLRVALEAVTCEDDDALLHALEPLEDEGRRLRMA
ncbi:MAG: PH domain-containing protein [Labilithrix sp.]|nr:PH domain-containing protein [Labilithrix sp.]MCW5810002.1 PH domain-containing protein [Labilithrix sp.]